MVLKNVFIVLVEPIPCLFLLRLRGLHLPFVPGKEEKKEVITG